MKMLSGEKVNRIDIKSSEYPSLLKEIKDPPPFLYFRGEWDINIFNETLSVVGSRRMTGYGEIITDEVVSAVAEAGITVVSGFMYGIDAKAHEAAVEAGGRTVAVMPCGIERIHPEHQAPLYEKILTTGGLAVSEYPGSTPPALWTYPRRNRIIAALSPFLLVVEAGLKSGALITARIAAKYRRNIFAVPGPLTSSVSLGTALLIKQGAVILTAPEDILNKYGKYSLTSAGNKKPWEGLNKNQKRIVDLLSVSPVGIDEIKRNTGRSASETGADVTILQLYKTIILKNGKYYLNKRGDKC